MATNIETRIRCEYSFKDYLLDEEILSRLGIDDYTINEFGLDAFKIGKTFVGGVTYLNYVDIFRDNNGDLAQLVILGMQALPDGFGMAFQAGDDGSYWCSAWKTTGGKLREWAENDTLGVWDIVFQGIWSEAVNNGLFEQNNGN